MAGPNRGPGRGPGGPGAKGGFQKPKNMGKTIRRLANYVLKSKFALFFVLLCLLTSVFTNLGGSYMQRGIINDFFYSGCTDFKGLALSIAKLVSVFLVGCLATYFQSATMVRIAQRGVAQLRKDLFDKLQELPLS